MASYKDYKTVAAAQKAGSMYFMGKDGKKKLAVTKEQLDAWKKKNKGKYTGSALTAWANAKGKDIKGDSKRDSSPRPKLRPGSTKDKPKVDSTRVAAEKKKAETGDEDAAAKGGKTVGQIKKTASDAISRSDSAKITYDQNKRISQQKRGGSTGEKFNAWYEKNGDKYGTMKEAMEAYQGTLKSGMSYGGMAKKKKMGMSKGGLIDMRKTGLFR